MDYDGQKFHYHPEQEKCMKKNISEKNDEGGGARARTMLIPSRLNVKKAKPCLSNTTTMIQCSPEFQPSIDDSLQ